MNGQDIAARVAARYETRALREYVKWKIRTDPVYGAVAEVLRGRCEPIADVGCGVGVLALTLREWGINVPIVGSDFDERKIEVGRRAAWDVLGVELVVGDARAEVPRDHNVVLLDVLQYLGADERRRVLTSAAEAVPPGGVVVIREGIRDASWRFRVTSLVDAAARWTRWLRAERLEFPTRDEIAGAFPGFDADVRPLWGRTPFNNYLFVFRKR